MTHKQPGDGPTPIPSHEPTRGITKPTGLLPFTRREYLVLRAVGAGAPFSLAPEAVSSVAIEHPEWDLAETKTFKEWDEQ